MTIWPWTTIRRLERENHALRMYLVNFGVSMAIPNPGTRQSVEEAAQRAVEDMVPAGVTATVRIEREAPGWVGVVVRLKNAWWRFWK